MKTPAIGEVFGRSWREAEGEARRDRALILRPSTPDSRSGLSNCRIISGARVRTHKVPLDSKLSGGDIAQWPRGINASDFPRNRY